MEKKVVFSETQHFRQIWLWLIVLGVNGFSIYIAIQTWMSKGTLAAVYVALAASALSVLAIWIMRLDTYITEDGIYVRLYPFQFRYKCFPWNKITRFYVRQYSPISEYGGWGIRGFGKNKAYNASGDQGLQLEMEDGARILIGTNQPRKLTVTLQELKPS